jgi:predicted NUDIX family phosphoesterase
MTQQILVLPREAFSGRAEFIPVKDMLARLGTMAQSAAWLRREEAERSVAHVQPIPSAVVRSNSGRILALERSSTGRHDLRTRISIVAGGHVDFVADCDLRTERDLTRLFVWTLQRELHEELDLKEAGEPELLGVVVDRRSLAASRHVGVIYMVTPDASASVQADEEFRSGVGLSGRYVNLTQLKALRHVLDPWSSILLRELLGRDAPSGFVDRPRLA